MKTLFKRLETLFTAVAFAEEGEFETAQKMVQEDVCMNRTKCKSQEGIHISPAVAHS